MDKTILKEAVLEARRFIKKAEEISKTSEFIEVSGNYQGAGAAAVKRASMDLTKVLAKLRNYRYYKGD